MQGRVTAGFPADAGDSLTAQVNSAHKELVECQLGRMGTRLPESRHLTRPLPQVQNDKHSTIPEKPPRD